MTKDKGKSLRRTQGEETRATLIRTGARLFARNGYSGVSMRTLAAEAGVNLATVGYHFGGKAGLYEAVIQKILDVRDQIFPPIGEVEARLARAGGSPEERAEVVDWFMGALINGLLGQTKYAWGTAIISRELAHPSEIFPKLEKDFFDPNIESLRTLVRGTAAHCWDDEDATITGFLLVNNVIRLLESHTMLCKQLGWESYADHLDTVERIVKTRCRGFLGLPMENAR